VLRVVAKLKVSKLVFLTLTRAALRHHLKTRHEVTVAKVHSAGDPGYSGTIRLTAVPAAGRDIKGLDLGLRERLGFGVATSVCSPRCRMDIPDLQVGDLVRDGAAFTPTDVSNNGLCRLECATQGSSSLKSRVGLVMGADEACFRFARHSQRVRCAKQSMARERVVGPMWDLRHFHRGEIGR